LASAAPTGSVRRTTRSVRSTSVPTPRNQCLQLRVVLDRPANAKTLAPGRMGWPPQVIPPRRRRYGRCEE
jgi:hypothetical protein